MVLFFYNVLFINPGYANDMLLLPTYLSCIPIVKNFVKIVNYVVDNIDILKAHQHICQFR